MDLKQDHYYLTDDGKILKLIGGFRSSHHSFKWSVLKLGDTCPIFGIDEKSLKSMIIKDLGTKEEVVRVLYENNIEERANEHLKTKYNSWLDECATTAYYKYRKDDQSSSD